MKHIIVMRETNAKYKLGRKKKEKKKKGNLQ